MRSVRVVVLLSMRAMAAAGLAQAREQGLIQALVPEQDPLKLSAKLILHGFARRDIVLFDVGLLAPFEKAAIEVSSMPLSETMVRRPAQDGEQLRPMRARHPKARERGVGLQRGALPAEVIDGGQHPETPTVREGI